MFSTLEYVPAAMNGGTSRLTGERAVNGLLWLPDDAASTTDRDGTDGSE